MKQTLSTLLLACAALALAAPAFADGFYGGISRRDDAGPAEGLAVGDPGLVWSRFSAPLLDESTPRSLVFGGYRWKNDVSVDAAVNATDKYALRPPSSVPGGVGLGLLDTPQRVWNADVFTSWEFTRSVSLYGRLGYAQSDTRPVFVISNLATADPHHVRDGVNYGVGLRYDMTHTLGLRVEYARFGRFNGDMLSGAVPDTDQVSVGVQFRF